MVRAFVHDRYVLGSKFVLAEIVICDFFDWIYLKICFLLQISYFVTIMADERPAKKKRTMQCFRAAYTEEFTCMIKSHAGPQPRILYCLFFGYKHRAFWKV